MSFENAKKYVPLVAVFAALLLTSCEELPKDKFVTIEGRLQQVDVVRGKKLWDVNTTTFKFEDGGVLIIEDVPAGWPYALHKINSITIVREPRGRREIIKLKEIVILPDKPKDGYQ